MWVVRRVRDLAKRAITWRARDTTELADGRSALVVAPHPDDETLGCGGVILRKLAAGSAVTVLMVTDGRHSHTSSVIGADELAALRRQELHEAAGRLGLPDGAVRWVEIEDGRVVANEGRLVAVIQDLLAELRPDDLYATSAAEPHPDHAAVGRAARRAAQLTGDVTLFEYPIWLWGSWPLQPGNRIGSVVEAVRRLAGDRAVIVHIEDVAKAKLHALEAHQTQLRRPTNIPDGDQWDVLPHQVMSSAAEPVEMFFPVDLHR